MVNDILLLIENKVLSKNIVFKCVYKSFLLVSLLDSISGCNIALLELFILIDKCLLDLLHKLSFCETFLG